MASSHPSPSSTGTGTAAVYISPTTYVPPTIPLPNSPNSDSKAAVEMAMPTLALGTWKADVNQTKNAVIVAVRDGGYRMIDCANDYGNEHEVGEALHYLISNNIVKREDLFIQCKLWNANMRKDNVKKDLVASLKDLKLDYVDNYVIHWPQACPAFPMGEGGPLLAWNGSDYSTPGKHDNNIHANHSKRTMFPVDDKGYYLMDKDCHYLETWEAMEELVEEGYCRGLGISNFNQAQIADLMTNGCKKYKPTVCQSECHLYLQEKDLQEICRNYGIVFQCYSPLGSSADNSAMCPTFQPEFRSIDHPIVKGIAKKHSQGSEDTNRTPAQVILRYLMQCGKAVVSKSITPSRILENKKALDDTTFILDQQDMIDLAKLNCGQRLLLWPACRGHPNYPFKDCYVGDQGAALAPGD